MKNRGNNDRRPRNRPRDGDARTKNAQGGRTRDTPGDRVANAYDRGVKGRTRNDDGRARSDERHARSDEGRANRGERHARDDRSGARREEFRASRDEPHTRSQETTRASRQETADARLPVLNDNAARRQKVEEDGAHVFGVQPVLEALRAGARPVERLTLAEGAHESRLREILEIARYADIPVRRVPRTELQRLSAGANHQGVVATIAAAHYTHAEDLLDALSARVGTNDPPLAVVLDGVEDPRNLGAVIRTIECAGAHGVFIPERRASGLTETVAKAAAGALEYVPVARAANVVRLMEELKGRGVWTVGAAADASKDYTEWDWTQPSAILLGGEGEGLRRLVRERCDVHVRIPLLGRIESLNVSVAAGIILYEAVRQRRVKKMMSDE
ncbi:MAG TPA: 23S rRNA (guanosine(2251)-2'-O)-methyltransferase RlmB [Pyrinomonadaceae bacterium]|jgi:23S rRNA (guanosine2251-2'-O)-methyltransferase|nr:23S rRNA (guanosine(2251)-2'-O)-methyltransferase RlmB [Pyrinomonadaceae bacterium]